ncbi:hypothetical protein [Roseiflexus castenholzii]|uniref:hypothetical protein n=1 Tax=Roseiflexus castenholzii TaxID=120962 RepID=UPI0012EE3391|nr:hypothetical protein [Roseiflexus castenholzii]
MIRVFFNSQSCNSQAPSQHDAGILLNQMMETVEQLDAIERSDHDSILTNRDPHVRDNLHGYYRDGPFESQRLTATHTFKDIVRYWLNHLRNSPDLALDRFRKFTLHLTSLPLASEVFSSVNTQWQRVDNNEDISWTALGYAAHFTSLVCEATGGGAAVVSISGIAKYDTMAIEVQRLHTDERRLVWNVAHPDHVIAQRRWYEAHRKHLPDPTLQGYVSAMDLSDEEAQQVLDRAVEIKGSVASSHAIEDLFTFFPFMDIEVIKECITVTASMILAKYAHEW